LINAKVVDTISKKELDIVELFELSESTKDECQKLFTMEAINLAIENLNLKYKRLDECDVKNIIEFILKGH